MRPSPAPDLHAHEPVAQYAGANQAVDAPQRRRVAVDDAAVEHGLDRTGSLVGRGLADDSRVR